MLQEISIRNFAIIEDLTIRFDSGLTVLSGETGAGKSIIINAVNLLLGSRASAALVRTGAESAELEALFQIAAGSGVARTMQELGYDPEEGLLVRRIISNNDRHRIYINGRLSTMQVLTAITADLASISGQHAHQGLLKEDEHLNILDQYGGLMGLRDQYQTVYRRIVPLIRKEQELLQRQARQSEQSELLRFQYDEIQAADIQADEDSRLEKERLRLKNGEALFQAVRQCVDELYNSDGAVVERLGYFGKELARAGEIDERLKTRAAEMEALTYGLEDLAGGLRDYLNNIDLDPGQLEAVEARLDTLNRLKRKYGGSLGAVLGHGEDLSRQLSELENLDVAIGSVRKELKACHAELGRRGEELSDKRQATAQNLSKAVEGELASLKMAGTRFCVQTLPLPAASDCGPYLCHNGGTMGESGLDRVTFMIAPNVGETLKPLAAIASGGELSRVVLALKAILAQNDSVESIVFDEVDAGIGGGVAELVGRKLAGLSRRHQVLCITHLPQIAKYGDHHFRISKTVSKGRTHTSIAPLSAAERVEELARMLGGEEITPTTRAHAKEMMDTGRNVKSKAK